MSPKTRKPYPALLIALLQIALLSTTLVADTVGNGPEFRIRFDKDICPDAVDGRLLLLISDDDSAEPLFMINGYGDSQLVFGTDVDALAPGEAAVIDGKALGYPLKSISLIPAGEYNFQALLHRYETFHRADGHTIKLPMDRGEGQLWNQAPGNLYSTPRKISIDPASGEPIEIVLDKMISPIEPLKETKYFKRVEIKSELLSNFWGREMRIGAHVLLPAGFDEHPEARYPLIIHHTHFPSSFWGFREEPPDPAYEGRWKTYYDYCYKLYRDWSSEDFPRAVLIRILHPTPYFDDSYAVNSANMGPYGDAINNELLPFIEEKFRCIGEPWARTAFGGSTGGWSALAVQIFYPDYYNGAWVFAPDPVDFRAFISSNIYEDKNVYYRDYRWKRTPKPLARDNLGHLRATMEESNHCELVLGTKSRSGDQLDCYQALFSPVGEDGYPKPLWNKLTGEIDHEVAEYWQENYDLRYILERDWSVIGPKLVGKLHVFTGDMDDYYLNNAVYLLEDFLESTANPYYGGEVVYGDRYGHCWFGDPDHDLNVGLYTVIQRFLPKMIEHMLETAPEGADVSSWRY